VVATGMTRTIYGRSFVRTFPTLLLIDSRPLSRLHRFEQIRYPENLITGGGFFSVGFPTGVHNVQSSGRKLPEYQLSVADVDALVKRLFELGNINAHFYSTYLNQEHAAKYFSFRNESPLF
jgi:hypothetical protein